MKKGKAVCVEVHPPIGNGYERWQNSLFYVLSAISGVGPAKNLAKYEGGYMCSLTG